MNFKFNWRKLIISIIIGIILNFIFWYTLPAPGGYLITGNFMIALTTLTTPTGIGYLIVSTILVYIIYSLFEKSTKH